MNALAPLASALLLTVAFAGCFAENSQVAEPTDDATDQDLPGAPPTASIALWIEGNASLPENGSFPAAVGINITFDASMSEGQGNLSFAWDFGDGNQSGTIPTVGGSGGANGTGSTSNATAANTTSNSTLLLNAPLEPLGLQPNQTNSTTNASTTSMAPSDTADGSVVTYAYGAEGNFTVTLYVTDEDDQTTTESVEVSVARGGPEPGTVIRTEQKKFTKSETCAVTDGVLGTSKTSTFEWVFNETEADGTPSVVQNVTIKGGPTDTKFIGPDGKEIAKGATIEAEGPFPAGKYKVTATSACTVGGTARNHNLNAWATIVAA